MKQILKTILAVLLATNLQFVSLHAQCNDGPSQAESDLWATHNCWWDFVLWQYQAYRMFDSDWGTWGFRDACNIALPYPKAVNASYLLTYGLTDNYTSQWHSTLDYRQAAEAWSSPNHDQIRYAPSASRAWLAQAAVSNARTDMGCLLFDQRAATGQARHQQTHGADREQPRISQSSASPRRARPGHGEREPGPARQTTGPS
jgi:hypothetical protein